MICLPMAALNRVFNIFQYFIKYKWYFVLKFEHFHEYLLQYSFKSGGTKYHFKRASVPGTKGKWLNVIFPSNLHDVFILEFNEI